MGDTEFIAWEHQSDRGTRPCNHGTAIREISRAHELMSQLQTLLLQPPAQPGGWPQEEAGDIVRESLRLTASALSALRSGAVAVEKDKCRRECTRRPSARNSRRKDETETWSILTDAPYVDGYEWRKYGQKVINNAKYPRSYYRCTFRELGCMARKTVQQEDSDGCPPCFTVEYSDEHTCKRGYSETPVSFVFESSSSSEQVCPVPLHAVGVGGGCGINNNTTPDFESLNELLFQYYEPQIFYTDQSSNNAPPPLENDEMRQDGEVGGAPDCLGSIVFGCHRP